MSERFTWSVEHRPDGWWAYVNAAGAQPGYWRGSRLTRWGATFAGWRRARRLNRRGVGR